MSTLQFYEIISTKGKLEAASQPSPSTDITVAFCRVNTLRRYIRLPGDDDGPTTSGRTLFLPDTNPRERRRILKIPVSYYDNSNILFLDDEDGIAARQFEKLTSLGIPEDIQEVVVKEVISEAKSLISDYNHIRGPGNGATLWIVSCIGFVELRECAYEDVDEEGIVRSVELESFEDDEFEPTPAARSAVDGLERVFFDDADDLGSLEENKECLVCLEKIQVPSRLEPLIRMPCLHVYHEHCIVRWLLTSHVCPLCRYAMPTAAADDDDDGDGDDDDDEEDEDDGDR